MTEVGLAPRRLESITFTPTAFGWMDCSFQAHEGPPLVIGASYVSNVLSDFLGMAASIALGSSRAACFTLHREPEASIVACLSTAGLVSLSVTSSEDASVHLFSATSAGLARLVCQGIRGVDREAYRADWSEHPFPEGEAAALESAVDMLAEG